MEAAALVVLAMLASKLLDFAKFLRAKDWNAVFTQVSAWAIGVAVLWVAGTAEVFKGVVIPALDTSIGSLDAGGLFLVGLSLTSLLSTVYDFKKALDNTDSAKTPPLTNL